MFTELPREPAERFDIPSRPVYPEAARIVVDTDRRTRELAEAMVRLNAEHPDGCTEVTLDREGFSAYEQRTLGPAATKIANSVFMRQLGDDPTNAFARHTDEQLIEIALGKVGGMLDIGQIVASLRGDLNFTNESIARIWPALRTRIAASIARSPVPVSS